MAEETLPIIKKLGNIVAEDTISGVLIRQIETADHTIYLATSGIGEVRAALAVQLLVDLFDVETILNFGFVGAIDSSLDISELVIVRQSVHHQFDISAVNDTPLGQYDGRDSVYFNTDAALVAKVQSLLPHPLKQVIAASGDKFVADKNTKSFLKAQFDADICEMEISGICLAAERNHVPVFSMKVVSDKADEAATVSFAEVLEKGLSKYEDVLPFVLKALADEKEKPLPPVKK